MAIQLKVVAAHVYSSYKANHNTVTKAYCFFPVSGNLIGRGSHSDVFKSVYFHPNTELRAVAIKLPKTNENDPEDVAYRVESFRKEYDLLRELNESKLLVTRVLGVCFFDSSTLFGIVMELGRSVYEVLYERSKWHHDKTGFFDRMLACMKGLSSTLNEMNDIGVIHNDVKLCNVLLFGNINQDFVLKLADVGLSFRYNEPNESDSEQPDAMTLGGTYPPPEVQRYIDNGFCSYEPENLKKIDSFAFGISMIFISTSILLQNLTKPIPEYIGRAGNTIDQQGLEVYRKAIEPNLVELEENGLKWIREVATNALDEDPFKRWSMADFNRFFQRLNQQAN